jgi:hypothetical protein
VGPASYRHQGQRSSERFELAIVRAYDRVMFYLALTLAYGPTWFKLVPVGGVILRREFGPLSGASGTPAELTELRAWLAHISSSDLPVDDPETGGQFV